MPEGPFVLLWAIGWGIVGALAALVVSALREVELRPLLLPSLLFSEVVGFSALVSARLIFPRFRLLPVPLELLLQGLTILSASVFGSVGVVLLRPLFFFAHPRLMAAVLGVNATVAVVTAIGLYTYDSMRRQLESQFAALRDKEALERELAIARDVQQQLLPREAPNHPELELAGICMPAIGVGGDYYDFFELSPHQVGLAVGDVSGKGIPAALLMAGLQSSTRSLFAPGCCPAGINTRLNDVLYRSSSQSRYATFFQAIYDATQGELTYSNAGHLPPLVLGRSGIRRLESNGFPLGLFDGVEYAPQHLPLERGDLIALFTDGVVEAPNHHDEEFGDERLIETLQRHRDEPLREVVARVLERLNAWGQGRSSHDDVTLVLARARGGRR